LTHDFSSAVNCSWNASTENQRYSYALHFMTLRKFAPVRYADTLQTFQYSKQCLTIRHTNIYSSFCETLHSNCASIYKRNIVLVYIRNSRFSYYESIIQLQTILLCSPWVILFLEHNFSETNLAFKASG
jgi:hypothetical protein